MEGAPLGAEDPRRRRRGDLMMTMDPIYFLQFDPCFKKIYV
jgi:hypothetical protein